MFDTLVQMAIAYTVVVFCLGALFGILVWWLIDRFVKDDE